MSSNDQVTSLGDDEKAVLEVHRRYNEEANAPADTALLAELWDDDPSNVFFNISGHNYRGLAHWSALWDYYRDKVEYDTPWMTWDENVTVNGDVALVTSLRVHGLRWIGEGESPLGDPVPRVTRSTEVMVRRDGQWKVVHAHFSYDAMSARPGNV